MPSSGKLKRACGVRPRGHTFVVRDDVTPENTVSTALVIDPITAAEPKANKPTTRAYSTRFCPFWLIRRSRIYLKILVPRVCILAPIEYETGELTFHLWFYRLYATSIEISSAYLD